VYIRVDLAAPVAHTPAPVRQTGSSLVEFAAVIVDAIA
jgi:hypothetical protein